MKTNANLFNHTLLDFSHPNDPPVIKVKGKNAFLFPTGKIAVIEDLHVNLLKCDNTEETSEQIYTKYSTLKETTSGCRKTKHGHYNYTVQHQPTSLTAINDDTLLVTYKDDDLRYPALLMKCYNMEDGSQNITTVNPGDQRQSRGGKMIYSDNKYYIATMNAVDAISTITCTYEKQLLWSKNIPESRYWSCLSLISKDHANDYLAAVSDDIIEIIDTENGNTVSQLKSPTYIRTICDLGGGLIATGGSSGILWSSINDIFIWDIHRREVVNTLVGHTNRIISICKLASNYIISSSEDNTIKVWDVQNSICLMTFQYNNNMTLQMGDGNTLHVFGNNEFYCFNAKWLISKIILMIQELDVATTILLNFSLSDSDRFDLFDSTYIELREQDFSAKNAFLATFKLCFDDENFIQLPQNQQKLFDARLAEACGEPFSPEYNLDESTRMNYLEQIKLENQSNQRNRSNSFIEANRFFISPIQDREVHAHENKSTCVLS